MINSWKIKVLIAIFTKFNHYDYFTGCEIYEKREGPKQIISLPTLKNLIKYLKNVDKYNFDLCSFKFPGLFLEVKVE